MSARETRWGAVPAEALPVRPTLLKVGADTFTRLMDYVLNQARFSTVVLPWCLKRQHEYWTSHGYGAERGGEDALHRQIDATVAVDLLEWQSGVTGPKAAVEWLKQLNEMVNS